MIVESGIIQIKPGDEARFEAGFAKGRRELESAAGFRKVEVRRGVETPNAYLLVVWWDSVEAHIAFTRSPAYGALMGAVGGYVAAPPQMAHYGVPI